MKQNEILHPKKNNNIKSIISMSITIFIFIALFIFSYFLTALLNTLATKVTDSTISLELIGLFATIVGLAVFMFYSILVEKRSLTSLGLKATKPLLKYVRGWFIGLVMFLIAYMIIIITTDSEIMVNSFNPIIILFLLGFILQGASEEIIFRGFLQNQLAMDNGKAFAILFSSILFCVAHILNPGIGIISTINLLLFSIFIGLFVIKENSIVGACALHSCWNFVQGNIFGLKVSGLDFGVSVLSTKLTSSNLISGSSFGPEGGLAVTIVLIISLAVIALSINKPKLR